MDRRLKQLGFYEVPNKKLKYLKCIKHKAYTDFEAFLEIGTKYSDDVIDMLVDSLTKHALTIKKFK